MASGQEASRGTRARPQPEGVGRSLISQDLRGERGAKGTLKPLAHSPKLTLPTSPLTVPFYHHCHSFKMERALIV